MGRHPGRSVDPFAPQPGPPWPAAVAGLGHLFLLVCVCPQEKGGADAVLPG